MRKKRFKSLTIAKICLVTVVLIVLLSIVGLPAGETTDRPYATGDEVVDQRTQSSRTTYLGEASYSWDGSIGAIHYENNGWQSINNAFVPAQAPWDWEMLRADYHIRVKEDFTTDQIIELEKQGEVIQLQPTALEWTNDLDQVQLISMPQSTIPVVTNLVIDLLPAVGVPSLQGTIRWSNAYGPGIDFQWKCQPTKLTKIIEISSLNDLSVPEQYILEGGNPVLRVNLVFNPPDEDSVSIVVDGRVWSQQDSIQTFNTIEFWKAGEILWGFMPLRYWGSGQDETNEGQSIATLEKRGNKLYISVRVPYSWLQSAVYPVFIDTDVNAQVGADTDDAYRRLSPSAFYLNNQLRAGTSNMDFKYGSGMRFTNITIPQAIVIDGANLILTSGSGNPTGAIVNTRISAEDVDDAPTFADNAAAFDTRWTARTTERIDWDAIPVWTLDIEYTSPEIKTVIQEIVDRIGWASGQDIVLFWEDFEDRSTHNANTYRNSWSYDESPAKAPKLHIEYTAIVIPNSYAVTLAAGLGIVVLMALFAVLALQSLSVASVIMAAVIGIVGTIAVVFLTNVVLGM